MGLLRLSAQGLGFGVYIYFLGKGARFKVLGLGLESIATDREI